MAAQTYHQVTTRLSIDVVLVWVDVPRGLANICWHLVDVRIDSGLTSAFLLLGGWVDGRCGGNENIIDNNNRISGGTQSHAATN